MNATDRHNMMRMATALRKLASLPPMNPVDTARLANTSLAVGSVGKALAAAASSMQYEEGQAAVDDCLTIAEKLIETYMQKDRTIHRR